MGSGRVCLVFIAEGDTDGVAPSIGVEGFDVFVPGDGDGLEHGLGEIGECTGDFGLDLTLGDCAKESRHGNAEIASGQQFCWKEATNVLTDLLGGEGFGFLLGVEVTEVQVSGAARSAALAAIGKGESTQVGGTVLLRCGRRANFFLCGRRTDFYMCGRKTVFILGGRKTANGTVRGHGSLQKVRFEL